MPWTNLNPMNLRKEFALRALETDNFTALCREYGISPKTGYKWKERLLSHGLEGMGEQSRRPHSSPGGLSEVEVCEIVRLKERHRPWGPRKLREIYRRQHGSAPSESSFKRVLERAGMVEKRRVRAARETGRLSSGLRGQAPNEVWTVDFKGWWYDPRGRCNPLTVRDEYSRYVLELRHLESGKSEGVRRCFERLFEKHGLPGAIRSDNGPPFASARGLLGLSRLSAWWLALGIGLERSRPGHPQDNGAHERMHLDMARELERAGLRGARQESFEVWRREFNEERPHEALGMRCPAEVWEASAQRYTGDPERIEYEGQERRRVMTSGQIGFGKATYLLSSALQGWDVGIKPSEDEQGLWEVRFCKLLLGWLEPRSESFRRAQSNTPQSTMPTAGSRKGQD